MDEQEPVSVYAFKLCCGHVAKVRTTTPDGFIVHQCDKVEAHVTFHEPAAPWGQLMSGDINAYGATPHKQGFYLVYTQRV